VRHLKEKDLKRLREAIKPPNASKKPELQAIIKSFSRTVSIVQSITVFKTVGINALFKVNRKIAT